MQRIRLMASRPGCCARSLIEPDGVGIGCGRVDRDRRPLVDGRFHDLRISLHPAVLQEVLSLLLASSRQVAGGQPVDDDLISGQPKSFAALFRICASAKVHPARNADPAAGIAALMCSVLSAPPRAGRGQVWRKSLVKYSFSASFLSITPASRKRSSDRCHAPSLDTPSAGSRLISGTSRDT